MATAKYLLRAPAEDMARWRDRAVARGKSFAEHIRDCLAIDERVWSMREGTTLVLERVPVEAAPATGCLGPDGSGAASTGDSPRDRVEPPAGVPSPPPVGSPVDIIGNERVIDSTNIPLMEDPLKEQARRLAERMRQR